MKSIDLFLLPRSVIKIHELLRTIDSIFYILHTTILCYIVLNLEKTFHYVIKFKVFRILDWTQNEVTLELLIKRRLPCVTARTPLFISELDPIGCHQI